MAASLRRAVAALLSPALCVRPHAIGSAASLAQRTVGVREASRCLLPRSTPYNVAPLRWYAAKRKKAARGMQGRVGAAQAVEEDAPREETADTKGGGGGEDEIISDDILKKLETMARDKTKGEELTQTLMMLEERVMTAIRRKEGYDGHPLAFVRPREGPSAVQSLKRVSCALDAKRGARVAMVIGMLIELEHALDTGTVMEVEADAQIHRLYDFGAGAVVAEVEGILSRAWLKPQDNSVVLAAKLDSEMAILERLTRVLWARRHPDSTYRAAQEFRRFGRSEHAVEALSVLTTGEQAHPPALLTLARMLETGEGVAVDAVRAKKLRDRARWMGALAGYRKISEYVVDDRKGANNFYEEDMERILEYDADGEFAADGAEAARFLQEFAAGGDTLADLVLGFKYLLGEDVAKDDAKALEHYKRAADAGLWKAQHNVACMLLTGVGGAKNPAQAVEYLRASAKKGHALSTLMLGVIYRHGMAGEKDLHVALKLFDEARRQKEERDVAAIAGTYRNLALQDKEGRPAERCYIHWAQLGEIDVSGDPEGNY